MMRFANGGMIVPPSAGDIGVFADRGMFKTHPPLARSPFPVGKVKGNTFPVDYLTFDNLFIIVKETHIKFKQNIVNLPYREGGPRKRWMSLRPSLQGMGENAASGLWMSLRP